jgi:fructan beta-fructosidase
MNRVYIIISIIWLLTVNACKIRNNPESVREEAFRPVMHFAPDSGWMNDPNGMVFFDSTYHLFYQYYPDSTVWGPMHWGYAISHDLINWQEQPIKLFPDSLGYIFSGSAVVDSNNTSGFGKDGKIPLVAIFTHHHPVKEKLGKHDHQNQSLAYSLDNGTTWVKYSQNPVLLSPGLQDFRDPKVFWHDETKKWIMALAAGDRVIFYSSSNLKQWKKESEFGASFGAHGGVWECPDLFKLEREIEGKTKTIWALLININPGAPNGGSGTQYFTGEFDGITFSPHTTKTKWLDFGPDNYAGVTWSNTGNRKIFMGWMSNWLYGQKVPTKRWRSAMTIARHISFLPADTGYYLSTYPVKNTNLYQKEIADINNIEINGSTDLTNAINGLRTPGRLYLDLQGSRNFTIILRNDKMEEISFKYNAERREFIIDRSKSGLIDFHPDFKAPILLPRIGNKEPMDDITLLIDKGSIEFFVDHGISTSTFLYFSKTGYNQFLISTDSPFISKRIVQHGFELGEKSF